MRRGCCRRAEFAAECGGGLARPAGADQHAQFVGVRVRRIEHALDRAGSQIKAASIGKMPQRLPDGFM